MADPTDTDATISNEMLLWLVKKLFEQDAGNKAPDPGTTSSNQQFGPYSLNLGFQQPRAQPSHRRGPAYSGLLGSPPDAGTAEYNEITGKRQKNLRRRYDILVEQNLAKMKKNYTNTVTGLDGTKSEVVDPQWQDDLDVNTEHAKAEASKQMSKIVGESIGSSFESWLESVEGPATVRGGDVSSGTIHWGNPPRPGGAERMAGADAAARDYQESQQLNRFMQGPGALGEEILQPIAAEQERVYSPENINASQDVIDLRAQKDAMVADETHQDVRSATPYGQRTTPSGTATEPASGVTAADLYNSLMPSPGPTSPRPSIPPSIPYGAPNLPIKSPGVARPSGVDEYIAGQPAPPKTAEQWRMDRLYEPQEDKFWTRGTKF